MRPATGSFSNSPKATSPYTVAAENVAAARIPGWDWRLVASHARRLAGKFGDDPGRWIDVSY